MGTELIQRATDSFERKQRRCLDQFEEPNLFSGSSRRSVALLASPLKNHTFRSGETYRLCRKGDSIIVVSGITQIGEIENPPSSVLYTMQDACQVAVGRVGEIFSMSGKAELSLESQWPVHQPLPRSR